MIKLNDGRYIIGFDDGYQKGKTATEVFENGIYLMGDVEPTIRENSLFYDGRYYKICEGRNAITEDKLSDENARLLTMVGMARELRENGIHKAEVILSVGLPFSNYGRDKHKLIEYYMSEPELNYIYEGKKYAISIVRVIACPQCYAAIASRLANIGV